MTPTIAAMALSCQLVSLCPQCGQGDEWDYGPGRYNDTTQRIATYRILKVFEKTLGKEAVSKLREKPIVIRWTRGVIDCDGVYTDGCFDPGLKVVGKWTVTVQSWSDCIADTALAHELLHAALLAAGKDRAYLDRNDIIGDYWHGMQGWAQNEVREELCQ